ncbi:MAG: sulfotransferase family 2 domain-containing protein [Candidatus Marinimicrobia bacterium]|nr:sulfotransferase family 2 domain-containing protein [Candidatus Neomarinimicrobiota bacterium]
MSSINTLNKKNISKKIIVFVHIQKTAGTTFKWILRNNFGLSHCDSAMTKTSLFNQERLNFAKLVFPALKSIAGHNLKEPTKHLTQNNLLFVTFLRDPVKRVISHHQDSILRQGVDRSTTIKEALEHGEISEHLNNWSTKMIAGEANFEKAKNLLIKKYSLVGLTQHFDKSVEMFEKISPYKVNINYTKRIVARKNHIKNKILNDKQKIATIKKHNREDIKLYNYVKNELFPQYIEKYGDNRIEPENNNDVYNSRNQPCYLRSKFYNKYFYRQIMKIRRKFIL